MRAYGGVGGYRFFYAEFRFCGCENWKMREIGRSLTFEMVEFWLGYFCVRTLRSVQMLIRYNDADHTVLN